MQVSKKLVVQTPFHLWKLLKNREEIYENNMDLVYFIDTVVNYMDGCKCDEDKNLKLVYDSYDSISNDGNINRLLKDGFSCDEIIFTK